MLCFDYDAVLFMKLVSFRRGIRNIPSYFDPMESRINVLICLDRLDKLKKTPKAVDQC